jgi:hypothetical protein
MLAVARASSKEKSAASDVAILFFTYQTGTIAHNFWRHPSKVSLVRKSTAAPHSYRTMSETGRNLSYRLYTRASAIGGTAVARTTKPSGRDRPEVAITCTFPVCTWHLAFNNERGWPGLRGYWEARRGMYDSEFTAWMDENVVHKEASPESDWWGVLTGDQ